MEFDWNTTEPTEEEMRQKEAERKESKQYSSKLPLILVIPLLAIFVKGFFTPSKFSYNFRSIPASVSISRPTNTARPAVSTSTPWPTEQYIEPTRPAPTATARPTGTPTQDPAVSAARRAYEIEIARQEAERQRVIGEGNMALAVFLQWVEYGAIFVGIIAAALVIFILFLTANNRIMAGQLMAVQMRALQNQKPVPAESVENRHEVVQVNEAEGRGAMQYEALSQHEKKVIIAKLKEGRRLVLNSANGMIPEKNGFSRGHLESIIVRLVAAGLGERRVSDGSLIFTEPGYKYFGLEVPKD